MTLPVVAATKRAPKRPETVPELLHRSNLADFRSKALLYTTLTFIAVVAWIAFFDRVPLQFALAAVGALGVEAARNLQRWWKWHQSRPDAGLVHPDRRREIEQETLKVMSDAARTRAWYTRGIVACITVPSLLEIVVGVPHAVETASVDPAAVFGGEPWRLLTGTYLHGSAGHFLGNMGALLLYGSILESKSSSLRVPLVYLVSALGGSAASVLLPPDGPSIGASGGVVGLIGYLYLFSRRQEVKFPAAFRSATASAFVALMTAGALGFWYIDNPGHAGGAIMGLVLAAVMVDPARNFGEEIAEPFLDLLGWVAVAVLIAGAVVTCLALIDAGGVGGVGGVRS